MLFYAFMSDQLIVTQDEWASALAQLDGGSELPGRHLGSGTEHDVLCKCCLFALSRCQLYSCHKAKEIVLFGVGKVGYSRK